MSSQLTTALENGTRVVYVTGDTPLLLDRAVAAAEAWGLERCGLPAFNHGRWRASDDRAEEAVITARTMPMMADMRVVVLRDLEQGRGDLCEAVIDYMGSPSPSTLFIVVAGSWGKPRKGEKAWGTRVQNAAKKSGFLLKLDASGVDRRRFTRDHAAGLGASLGAREAELLVELVGDDLGRLAQEVEKLVTYVGAGEITTEALQEVCSALAEEDIWALTSGIATRDPDLALRSLHRLLDDNQEPHYLLAMVVMQLRKVLQGQQLLRAGRSPYDVGRALRLGQAEQRALASGAHLDPAHTLDRLMQANLHMNSHRAGGQRILEGLVVDLCTG